MSVVLIISALVVAYGLGCWSGAKTVRRVDVRKKLAHDIAVDLIDEGLAREIARAGERLAPPKPERVPR